MNKEDWKKVEDALESLYRIAVLDCDGYKLSLNLVMATKYRNEIRFYVDGWLYVKWVLEDCEERRRFCRPVHRRKYKKASFKGLSKRTLKTWKIDPDEKYTTYGLTWKSFVSLKRHLIANNKEITLVEVK